MKSRSLFVHQRFTESSLKPRPPFSQELREQYSCSRIDRRTSIAAIAIASASVSVSVYISFTSELAETSRPAVSVSVPVSVSVSVIAAPPHLYPIDQSIRRGKEEHRALNNPIQLQQSDHPSERRSLFFPYIATLNS